MEFINSDKIRLRDIFLDNGNWWRVFFQYKALIRPSIIINVLKLLICRTAILGFHLFSCPSCDHTKKIPHTCKSRFCPSCGKRATDDWIKNSFNTLPHTIWQHITFTLPDELWPFFWYNRHLMNSVPPIAAHIVKKLAKKRGFLPGIFLAVHTFGRDLKRNFHLHLSTTVGGLSPDNNSWIKGAYFYHQSIKNMWRYEIIAFFRREFQKGNLVMPRNLRHIKSYETFCSWTSKFYNVTWVVHLNKQSNKMKYTIEYLGKYLKRPPIGETRITHYDGHIVSFQYLDHYTNTTETFTLPVLDFISRLIVHIPDLYFRNIRYYGFLSNRLRGKLLPIVYQLLQMNNDSVKVYTPWRYMIQNTFKYDPLKCPHCNKLMILTVVNIPLGNPINPIFQNIANGYYPLL